MEVIKILKHYKHKNSQTKNNYFVRNQFKESNKILRLNEDVSLTKCDRTKKKKRKATFSDKDRSWNRQNK